MGKKILVVDNDRLMAAFMGDLLSRHGHEVRTAQDGIAALEVLEGYVPDVIFLDLIMPHISGDRLLRMIRKMPELQNVHVAIVSAVASEETERLTDLGANRIIAKGPIDEMAAEILAAVEEAGSDPSMQAEDRPPEIEGRSRRRITQEILAIQRHLSLLLNNLYEGILELTPEGKVIFANNAALRLWGGMEEKVLGKPFVELFDEPERQRIGEVMAHIGSGLPEIIDPFSLNIQGAPVSLKIIPLEDDLNWSVMVIAAPIRKPPSPPLLDA